MQSGALPELAVRLLGRFVTEMNAEGLARLWPGGAQPVAELLCGSPQGLDEILRCGASDLPRPGPTGASGGCVAGRPVLTVRDVPLLQSAPTLLFWRPPGAPPWQAEHLGMATAAAMADQAFLQASPEPDQALIDRVTRMPTRIYFLEDARRQLARLDREALPSSILVLTVDGAERLHGSLGRAALDRMLRQIAVRLRGAVRPADLVGRIGTSAFAAWLAGADHLVTAERAEALRAEPIAALRSDDVLRRETLTLSLGIATRWPGTRQSISQLLERAQQAAEEASRRGGAQWCVAPDLAA